MYGLFVILLPTVGTALFWRWVTRRGRHTRTTRFYQAFIAIWVWIFLFGMAISLPISGDTFQGLLGIGSALVMVGVIFWSVRRR